MSTRPSLAPDAEPWRTRAACVGVSDAVFYPGLGGNAALARSVCARCPVAGLCLTEALTVPEHMDHGVWGGTTPMERREIRARQAKRQQKRQESAA